MRLSLLLVAFMGVAAAAATLQVAGSRIIAGETTSQQEFMLEVPDDTDIAQPDPDTDTATVPAIPHRARPVAPDVVAIPPVETSELLRVEEREPLSEIGRAPDPRDLPPQEMVLHRPVASAAGAFAAQGHSVVLDGIEVTAADETCGQGEAAWKCGVHARTAFRRWLRGRALTCVVRPVPITETVVTACRLGTQDAADWLVSQGWVKAAPGGPYEELGEIAMREGRGLFGPAP